VRLEKLPVVGRNLFRGICNFKREVSAENPQDGQAQVIIDLMGALWRISLMLALYRLLLNGEQALRNVLKKPWLRSSLM
jgi:hypothetical protein